MHDGARATYVPIMTLKPVADAVWIVDDLERLTFYPLQVTRRDTGNGGDALNGRKRRV